MNNSDLEDQLYYSYSDTPFECPYCQEERSYRHMMPPPGRPPSVNPSQNKNQQPGVKAVDPGAIRPCTYRYVYIYPRRGRAYWAWLTYVGKTSSSGYKWTGRDWVYFGVDLRQIESFNCY